MLHSILRRAIPVLAVPLALGTAQLAAQPATAPTSQEAPAEELKATITSVQGMVQVREGEAGQWRKAEVGMVVGAGGEFRTGTRSAVRFEIPPDQTVTLDRLGVVKLIDAVKTTTAVKTDLGMKYGRVRYDIEAAGLQHDSTIHSPGSSLAVRGTQVLLYNQGFYPIQATSITGPGRFSGKHGTTTLGALGSKPIHMNDGDASAGVTLLTETFIDPTSRGSHSTTENSAIIAAPLITGFSFGNLGQGAAFTSATGIGGTPSTTPPQNTGGGGLVFQLVWVASSPSDITPDLDLVVRSPLGEVLKPKGGVAIVPSGGHSPVDDKGNSGSRAGQEFAFWPGSFPTGKYNVQVQHASGGSAEFQLYTVKNGQQTGTPTASTISSENTPIDVSVDINNGKHRAGKPQIKGKR